MKAAYKSLVWPYKADVINVQYVNRETSCPTLTPYIIYELKVQTFVYDTVKII